MSDEGEAIGLILDPGERGVVGSMTVENLGAEPVELAVRGTGAVLRGKMIIRAEDATSPALRVYYVVQSMYIDPATAEAKFRELGGLVEELVNAVPSTGLIAADIGQAVLEGDFLAALSSCLELLRYEEFLEKKAAGTDKPEG